jgi:hypothetical protein
MMWALGHDAALYGDRVPGTQYLWTAVRDDVPRLQVWYVLGPGDLCDLRWIEDV